MSRPARDKTSSTDTPSVSRSPASRQRGRKPYLRPALQSYGSLVDLTRFGGSQVVDSGGLGQP